MKKLSLKGLADYMTAEAARQRTILRQYKYPSEDDARVKIMYYREARDRISAFHRGRENPNWLLNNADQLQTLASLSRGSTRTRLNHNARVLRSYKRYFSEKEYEVLKDLNLELSYGDVIITVRPDLHVREGRREKIIKYEFGVEAPIHREINIISQIMFESANNNGMALSSANVLYIDITRGHEHHGARLKARMARDVEATCQNISAIWDSI
jgi:hypothetical protein